VTSAEPIHLRIGLAPSNKEAAYSLVRPDVDGDGEQGLDHQAQRPGSRDGFWLRSCVTREDAMVDTTPVTAEICRLISIGERELLSVVVRRFPDLTRAELSQALQEATAAAERQAMRKH
jgi:hypothetical protein